MKEVDKRQLLIFFEEFQDQTEDDLHQRILNAAINGGEDFLFSMENELGNYLIEVLKNED